MTKRLVQFATWLILAAAPLCASAQINLSQQITAELAKKIVRTPNVHAMMFTPQTWFVRRGGGTLWNASTNPTGQCDGLADTDYASGTDAHCAVNHLQRLYLNGVPGSSAWVIGGGDTVVIHDCAALPGEQNPDAPHCRIGTITDTNDPSSSICQDVSAAWGCSMPPPPAGTSGLPTRILGYCAYVATCTGPANSYPYTTNNLTQLFGGFGNAVMFLQGTQWIDIEGLEITSHNGACTRVGSPQYPAPCSTSGAMSDFSPAGIETSNTTSNITMANLYIHGFTSVGIGGAIGGPFTLSHVMIAFNPFAGWNFDDGTPDASGSTITQSYVSLVGNGCLEEYPITHPAFPAKACWDTSSSGFGDAWSGQDSTLDSFTCDHCAILFNVKDGALGPHTIVHNISLTNSEWIGNSGQNGKWGQDVNATYLMQNNFVDGNCAHWLATIPGAPQTYSLASGLPGAYVGDGSLGGSMCRASGSVWAYFTGAGSTVNFIGNTIVTYMPTIWDLGCAPVNTCDSTPYNFKDNVILGYSPSYTFSPFSVGTAPGVFFADGGTIDVVSSHNLEFGVRNGDCPSTGSPVCSDPHLVGEPAQGSVAPTEAVLDAFNFIPASGSPVIGAGVNVSGLTTDNAGNARPSPPSIGAREPGGFSVIKSMSFGRTVTFGVSH